jgi:hypothetical protein
MIVEVHAAMLCARYQQLYSRVVVSAALRFAGLKTAPDSSFEANLADWATDWEVSRQDGIVRAMIVLKRRH